MDDEELAAIRERDAEAIPRFFHAGMAVPEAALLNAEMDRRTLLAEVEQLTRWKAEMMVVLEGLQELGDALGLELGDSITGTKALEAVNKLKAENAELRESLEGMVSQHCAGDDGELDSFALSASADAIDLLARLGRLNITHDAGRRVIGKWKEADDAV